MKRLVRTFNRLTAGVTIHRGRIAGQYSDHPPLTMKLYVHYYDNLDVFRVLITVGDQAAECYENKSLNALRKLTMAYHPSAAKHFGPARMYVGI